MLDRPARPWAGELAPVLPIAAIEVVGTHFAGHHQTGVRHYDLGAALLLIAGAAALAGRRRRPGGPPASTSSPLSRLRDRDR